jgi:hypothetical protein
MWDGSCNQNFPSCLSSYVNDGTYYYVITLYNCSGSIENAGFVTIFGARNAIIQNPTPSQIEASKLADSGEWIISCTSATEFQSVIYVMDMSGRVLFEKEIMVSEGQNRFPISTEVLAAGMYLIKIDGFDGATKVLIGH